MIGRQPLSKSLRKGGGFSTVAEGKSINLRGFENCSILLTNSGRLWIVMLQDVL